MSDSQLQALSHPAQHRLAAARLPDALPPLAWDGVRWRTHDGRYWYDGNAWRTVSQTTTVTFWIVAAAHSVVYVVLSVIASTLMFTVAATAIFHPMPPLTEAEERLPSVRTWRMNV